MASKFDVTSTAAEVAAQLVQAGHNLSELDAPDAEAGRAVINAARPPRVTGALAAGQAAVVGGGRVAFASSARYWTFVHWGAPRRNIRANPWYRDAVRAATSDVVAVYAEHARRSLP